VALDSLEWLALCAARGETEKVVAWHRRGFRLCRTCDWLGTVGRPEAADQSSRGDADTRKDGLFDRDRDLFGSTAGLLVCEHCSNHRTYITLTFLCQAAVTL
jgi:hypothetical protein